MKLRNLLAEGAGEGNRVRSTPPAGLPFLNRQKTYSGRYSIQPGPDNDSLNDRPWKEPESDFTEILREIELARLPLMKAYKTVMLGSGAILNPGQTDPGGGPPGIGALLDTIRDAERRLARPGSQGAFYLKDLPAFEKSGASEGSGPVPSYSSGMIKYLFSGRNPGKVGLGVAVSLDDYLAVELDDYGEVSYDEHKSFGARPFLCMPPKGLKEAAKDNEVFFEDRGGYGHYVPTFIQLYSEFAAFALQEHPAVLGAHLLAKRFPVQASKMLADHNELVSRLTSSVLHFMGYESSMGALPGTGGRREMDKTVLSGCGMELVSCLIDWRDHCCKTLTQEEFAQSFWNMRVEKVNDLGEYVSNRATVPPMSYSN